MPRASTLNKFKKKKKKDSYVYLLQACEAKLEISKSLKLLIIFGQKMLITTCYLKFVVKILYIYLLSFLELASYTISESTQKKKVP